MTSIEHSNKLALWLPGWYELDQPLNRKQRTRMWFYQVPPSDIPNVEAFDFVFFNQLSNPDNCQVREATIGSIEHEQLGTLRQVDTQGLDYLFFTDAGETLVVNAEEKPGDAQQANLNITNWCLKVTLEDVSGPLTELD